MTATKDIIAVTENIPQAGAIVWWRLSGGLQGDKLYDAWDEAGFDVQVIPENPAPPTALRRAMNDQKQARRLVRPLEGRKGYAVVNESAKADDLDYDISVRASVSVIGMLTVESDYDGSDTQRLIAEVEASYKRHCHELSTQDISSWLSCIVIPKVDGVSLRDTGGMYFIPHDKLAEYSAMVDAVAGVSGHSFFKVPALRSADAVDAILDAVTQEAAAEASKFEADLEAGNLGERALSNRVESVEAAEAKVARYEKLLGAAMPELSKRLEQLRANLTVASMQAAGGADLLDAFGG
jgi:hypothetical protein